MRILHLASHTGNIGDNASHIGFRKILSSLVKDSIEIVPLEMRRFYTSYSLPDKLYFDQAFASLANTFDLLVIGGGGFLDFWVAGSITGTTLDIPEQVLQQIKTPVFITSMGCIPHKDVPEGNVEKFRRFLDVLLNRGKTFIAVRNDGSSEVLRDVVGRTYFEQIPEVLDHGFFYQNDGSHYLPCREPYIVINTTNDQVKMLNRRTGRTDESMFVQQMQHVIAYIIDQTDLSIVFAPHIYVDYNAINLLVDKIDNFHLRSRIIVTPHVQGDYGCNQIFSAYKNSELALGMRFHANVCSFALGIPSVGIAVLDRISSVYEKMGMPERAIPLNENFSDRIISNIHSMRQGTLSVVDSELLKNIKLNTTNLYTEALANFELL